MHEFSLVLSVTDLATKEAEKSGWKHAEKVAVAVGELSGVELSALEFAWKPGTMGSVLEGAELIIEKVEGEAVCSDCGKTFEKHQLYDACPHCGSYLHQIHRGREFFVQSITVND